MENKELKFKRDKINALNKRNMVAEIKLASGCMDCGYNTNALALEFDHRPGTKKNATVASLMYRSWDIILEEINKCDIVCSNCHAIRTFSR